MTQLYAKDFGDILEVLGSNESLKAEVLALIGSKPIHAKATEEPQRQAAIREVMADLVNGKISGLEAAYQIAEARLPRATSLYGADFRVFPSGWAERHVRTLLSRFYNQAVLERLIREGKEDCFVHHSTLEDASSPCSMILAGKVNKVKELHDKLIKNYELGQWDKTTVKIPHHPHCTHVVHPIDSI